MNLRDRLLVCRVPNEHNPQDSEAFGVVPASTLSFRRLAAVEEVSLEDVLHDLRLERAAYFTATVGTSWDKLAVEPCTRVHRIVGDDGSEWLATRPDDTSRDNLRSLLTRAQLDKWLLWHATTL